MMNPDASPSRKTVARTARVRQPSARAAAGLVVPVVRLSLSVEPLVSIVQRHVKVSEKARRAIQHDLAELLGRADVQLLMDAGPVEGVAPDTVLTTEQAAQLAGVSRPHMVKLIDSGMVELHQKVGNQRRVLRSAVERWQATERKRQAQALKRLVVDLDEEILAS